MVKSCKLFNSLLLAALLLGAASLRAETTPRGDYDGDGVQDIGVALSRDVPGSLIKTEVLVKGSSAGQAIYYTLPLKTDAFINGKYFQGQPTAVASVLATSANESLLWTFIRPSDRQTVQLRFGLVGDMIANAMNFDLDSLDDLFVVRTGPANEVGDSKKYLHWLVSLSAYGGTVIDQLFGLAGDQVFTFYNKGEPYLAVARLETEGVCSGQIAWYFSRFQSDPGKRSVSRLCWGLSGDIPLSPVEINGKLKVIVVRPTGDRQLAYIRDANGSTAETMWLGLSNAIPAFGNLVGKEANLYWVQRSTPGLGEISYVGVRRANGKDDVFPFGITSNIILRPDGTTVAPTDSGRLISNDRSGLKIDTTKTDTGTDTTNTDDNSNDNSSSGECANVVSVGRLGGVLYKPVNLHGGRGPTLIVKNTSQRTYKSRLQIRNMKCQQIATIGLFTTDKIYGSRYYMKSGGTGQTAGQLLELAKRAGSNSILIEGVRGSWIKIANPLNREGGL